MRGSRRRAAWAVLVVAPAISLGASALIASARGAGARPPRTPFAAGRLEARTLAGRIRPLGEDSTYTLLYLSAHCPFCRAERDVWTSRLSADPGLEAPVVVVGRDTSPGEAARFLDRYPGPVFLDPDGRIARALRVTAVPYTALIDRSGIVVQVHLGITGGRATETSATHGPDVIQRRSRR